ncbi:hypothetical protein FQR65_LT12335 [Abscondita terminalis]|nr:hypothetical protein FQR65_LT12335 [Abscondita terminalis]
MLKHFSFLTSRPLVLDMLACIERRHYNELFLIKYKIETTSVSGRAGQKEMDYPKSVLICTKTHHVDYYYN